MGSKKCKDLIITILDMPNHAILGLNSFACSFRILTNVLIYGILIKDSQKLEFGF